MLCWLAVVLFYPCTLHIYHTCCQAFRHYLSMAHKCSIPYHSISAAKEHFMPHSVLLSLYNQEKCKMLFAFHKLCFPFYMLVWIAFNIAICVLSYHVKCACSSFLWTNFLCQVKCARATSFCVVEHRTR